MNVRDLLDDEPRINRTFLGRRAAWL